MLVLLFLYIGVIALNSAFENKASADKATAILSLVGLVNTISLLIIGRRKNQSPDRSSD
jgi:ABC-type transport system involved in cytochrome c biogenesis permease subunit